MVERHQIPDRTGHIQKSGKQEWYHQFLSDLITSPAELATQNNGFFY